MTEHKRHGNGDPGMTVNGLGIVDAALQVLHPAMAPQDQEHGWTLDQAVAALSHIKGSAADWREATAYLACQFHTLNTRNGEAERLAISQISAILRRFRNEAPGGGQ